MSLTARAGGLFLDIENGKSADLDLVSGLLEGLKFASLMELNSELLGAINRANRTGNSRSKT